MIEIKNNFKKTEGEKQALHILQFGSKFFFLMFLFGTVLGALIPSLSFGQKLMLSIPALIMMFFLQINIIIINKEIKDKNKELFKIKQDNMLLDKKITKAIKQKQIKI